MNEDLSHSERDIYGAKDKQSALPVRPFSDNRIDSFPDGGTSVRAFVPGMAVHFFLDFFRGLLDYPPIHESEEKNVPCHSLCDGQKKRHL